MARELGTMVYEVVMDGLDGVSKKSESERAALTFDFVLDRLVVIRPWHPESGTAQLHAVSLQPYAPPDPDLTTLRRANISCLRDSQANSPQEALEKAIAWLDEYILDQQAQRAILLRFLSELSSEDAPKQ